MEKIVRKSYKFRIYPSKSQVTILENTLDLCRELYNAALQERRDAWKLNRISISYFDQANQLPAIKSIRTEFNDVYSQVLQDVLKRIDRTFKAFFDRVKRKEKFGFPRFKGENRFDSFCFPQSGFSLTDNKLMLSKIGKLKIKLSRQIQGKVKTCRIKREIDKWFVIFSVETISQPLPKTGKQIGIDVGIENFLTLSDGTQIENPRYFENLQKQFRIAQRSIVRKKKDSKSRKKAVLRLRKIHQKVCRQRNDFHHKLSIFLVKEFDLIVCEDLNIKGLSKGFLSKQIHDVAWGNFLNKIEYKAECADKRFLKVNPNGTSQTCICGESVRKNLSVRYHKCTKCGYKNHRDIVSAQVILNRALGTSVLASNNSLELLANESLLNKEIH